MPVTANGPKAPRERYACRMRRNGEQRVGRQRALTRAVLLALCASSLGGCPKSPEGPTPPPDPMSEEALLAEVTQLCDPKYEGRGSYQAGSARVSQYLVEEFRALGYRVERQKVRGRFAENIFAIKAGDEQAVMVSAHHDHLGRQGGEVYPGADDNASGLAVVLAMARSRAMRDYKHTVIFASFGAEEDGLVGSGIYVHAPLWPLDKTRALINFDMVGRNFFEAGSGQEATAAVVGLEGAQGAKAIAEAAAAEVGLKLIPAPARLLELFNLHDRTDDWWFRRQGIAAIHFSTGLHPDYHQTSDTVGKIVPSQLARVAHTAAAVLDELAGESEARSVDRPVSR